jgi:cell division protein FtsQ
MKPLRERAAALVHGHRALVAAGSAIVVIVAAVWIVAFSPVLGVSTVVVHGTDVLTPAQVRAAAAVKHGTPLIRLDTGSVARRVEQLPEVKSAHVGTSFPNTVTIDVVERTPVGYLAGSSGYTLVDGSGVRYRTVKARPAKLPLFDVPAGTAGDAAAAAVAGVAADLTAGLLTEVASISALDPSSITLLLTDHRVVRWGSADRSADKAKLLPTLLLQPGTQFDVSNPDQVIAR